MSATLDQIKREGPTLVARMVALGLARRSAASGLSASSLEGRKYKGPGGRQASQGGCLGLRQRHAWSARNVCIHCGKVREDAR